MKEATEQTISLATIDLDNSPQARIRLDEETVLDYREKLERGEEFPPLRVMVVKTEAGEKRWLTDGHHTYNALTALGRERYKAMVSEGTEDEAFWAAMAANSKHGLQRSNADKRNAVKQALEFTRFKLSSRTIADRTGTSAPFVESIRKPLEDKLAEKPAKREGSDGRKVTKKEKAAPAEPAQHELGMSTPPANEPLNNTKSPAEERVRDKIAEAITESDDLVRMLDDAKMTPAKLISVAKELEKFAEQFRKLATELAAALAE